ncbi:hypothetical protein [Gemmata sp.]|uniref:hypothetical protein n=1 Tax=Gemmata sp. TaxID=1914242 RepID=UPI003F729F2D
MSLTLSPRPPVRAPATDEPPADPVRGLLARLLSPGAEPPAFAAVASCPPLDLSPAECHAARRAAACPDLFVAHAPDAAVRERVVAAVARLCGAGRCLVLTPNPAAADRIAERLARLDAACVARALADDENPVRPSPLASKVTSAALGAAHADALKSDAAAAVAAADARLSALEHLAGRVAAVAGLEADVAACAARHAAVEAAVRSETDTPFAARLAGLRATHEQHAARLTAEVAALELSRSEKEAALATAHQQHAELAAPGAKKPGLLGRLFGGGKHGPDPVELEKLTHALEADLAAIAAGTADRRAQLAAAAAAHASELEAVVQAEVAARRTGIEAELAPLTSETEKARSDAWAAAAAAGVTSLAADELTAARYATTLSLVEAKERAAEAVRSAPDAARRHLERVPVVVGTPGSVHVDPAFGRGPDGGAPFDLLVLDQAEELGENDFVQLAKLATRWVLIGDAALPDEPKPTHNGTGPRRNGRPVEVPFAARLARALDHEPWAAERDRLVFRLVRVAPEQRRSLSREAVIDRPEVELRILDTAAEPVLAEVAFPLATDVAAAKAFLFRELGETLLRPLGTVRWEATPAGVTACWPDAGRPDGTWIDLEPGVRERVCGAGCGAFTAAISFDASAGWDADRAAEWLAARVSPESSARYAAVPRSARG